MAAVTRTPVVLVHGWAGSAESWQPVVRRMDSASWNATALRLPGSRGGSPGLATVSHAADELAATLAAFDEPVLIVGHSMGAQVTMLAHARVPHLVLSEVVIDPAYAGEAGSRPEMAAWATRIEDRGLSAVSDFFASATSGMSTHDARQVMADMRLTSPADIASYLRSEYVDADAVGLAPHTARVARLRKHPVLSVHSTQASEDRESSLPSPPGSASEIWPGHGHYLHLEDADRFVALLARWRTHLLSDRPRTVELEHEPS